MQVLNHTPLPTRVSMSGAERDEEMMGIALVAMTCRVREAKRASAEVAEDALRLVVEQRPLKIGTQGELFGDGEFGRQEASVGALGFGYAPRSGAQKARLALRVGDEARELDVQGPRVWRRTPLGLSPSAPEPFDRVAITWGSAYGGFVRRPAKFIERDGKRVLLPPQPIPYPQNPDGVGYYLDASEAAGNPLPQVERADEPIRAWDDRPTPGSFAPYPMYGGLRATRIFTMVDDKPQVDFRKGSRLLARAAPWLTFATVAPGTPITLTGMRPSGGVLAFRVPEPPAIFRARIGAHSRDFTLKVEDVEIDAEALEARFVYRVLFGYPLVAHDVREAEFIPTPSLERTPFVDA